jgi:hypothetical protein
LTPTSSSTTSLPSRGWIDRDRAVSALDPRPRGGEHPLAVVAAGQRLDDGRRPVGEQAGEEQAGLDLGAGDREPVLDAAKLRASNLKRRQPIVAAADVGSHLAQRLGDPVDRAPANRVVAVESPAALRLTGEPARQQPQQGAGIADIDLGRAGAAQAEPADAHSQARHDPALGQRSLPIGRNGHGPLLERRFDLRPECRHGVERRAGIRGIQVSRDPRLPLAHRRDQRRAV